MQPEASWGQSTRWLTCLTIDSRVAGVTREQVRLALETENIEARPVWKPMHLQPVFATAEMHGGQVSERLFDQGLCLPSGAGMNEEDRNRAIAAFTKAFTR
jgi:pyridoxal phosphate-dependent aminotransferase EpsN